METRVGRALGQCWCDPKGLTGRGQRPVHLSHSCCVTPAHRPEDTEVTWPHPWPVQGLTESLSFIGV